MNNSLPAIALKYKSDKAEWGHNYVTLYENYFAPLRSESINLLEIGIGDHGGDSLRIWRDYFPRALNIVGLDKNHAFINHANTLSHTIKALYTDQSSKDVLFKTFYELERNFGLFEIIIDDASHNNDHIINTFEVFWPLLTNGGIYVIEDTYSSWLSPDTSATKRLLDLILPQINDHVSGRKNELGVFSIHCYREIIFILKGKSVTK